jgi:GTP-binding protein
MAAGSFGDDSGYEVAIAGRSNSGKSSALNAIVRNQGLARTSRTPGRTQAVNMFELEPGRRIVDLPGYGHANVPAAVRAAWARLMDAYFAERESLSGLLIVVDARRVLGARAGVQMFSAESGDGVSAAQGALEAMLTRHAKTPGDP